MKTIPPNPKDDDSLDGSSDSSSLQLFDNESFQQQLSSDTHTKLRNKPSINNVSTTKILILALSILFTLSYLYFDEFEIISTIHERLAWDTGGWTNIVSRVANNNNNNNNTQSLSTATTTKSSSSQHEQQPSELQLRFANKHKHTLSDIITLSTYYKTSFAIIIFIIQIKMYSKRTVPTLPYRNMDD